MLADRSHTDLIEEVSRNVLAAPRIRRLADVIVARLSASGATFNGVHLRLEQDANWQDRIAGGQMVRTPRFPRKSAERTALWVRCVQSQMVDTVCTFCQQRSYCKCVTKPIQYCLMSTAAAAAVPPWPCQAAAWASAC